jgi:hypothetical protein
MSEQLHPTHIMETAWGFWSSKVLLTAVEVDLFTTLGDGVMTAQQLGDALGLHPRGTYDFFDSLVALKFLNRDGDGPEGRYSNTPETAVFLNKMSPAYMGGILEMHNARTYGFWNNLSTALRTGKPQNETKDATNHFEELYANEARLVQFLEAMSGTQTANFQALAEKFDFSKYKTVSDIGGALALLSRIVGERNKHLSFTSFDLVQVLPHAQNRIEAAGMSNRIAVASGDFFGDVLPKADVVTMGNILHDWNLEKKKILIKKAYEALPEGGAFIAIEKLIDDARRENVFGLLGSLNMLIEFGDAFDYTGDNFREWCTEAGFKHFEFIHLAGPTSAAIAYK